jgi:very-short-patch-repair endonuclease
MSIKHARRLRRDSTDAERRLWAALRSRRLVGYKFRRQHPIGPFIVDFVCTRHRVVVEADGGQHATDPGDAVRISELQRAGWRILRFWNPDILTNTQGVIEAIASALQNPSPALREREGPTAEPWEGEGAEP